MLGIQLTDADVGNVPLLAPTPTATSFPDPNGFPQVVIAGRRPHGDPPRPRRGQSGGQSAALGISHVGARPHRPRLPRRHRPQRRARSVLTDGDIEIGLGNRDGTATDGDYDNELLDAHFIAGDGRVNENIGLTAVHHVFHAEHNRLVEHTKEVVLADAATSPSSTSGSTPRRRVPQRMADQRRGHGPPASPASSGTASACSRPPSSAPRCSTSTSCSRNSPARSSRNINVFLVPDGYDVTIDPSIVAEFAHVVYRFGHSMLTETIDRFDPTFTADQIGLIEGFLNPLEFQNNGGTATVDADIAAGAIIRGMTRQVGNEIDEFVTSALRNNLLGLPLDLATINLARGRDTGVPSLNAARREFYEATNENSLLKPYESWVDFAGHLKNEASIINFIAAYGTHALITGQTTLEGKRDAALTIITGVSVGGLAVPADAARLPQRHRRLGQLPSGVRLGGLDNVDLWIGGLAEEIMPFGGMLGSTFNFVFEMQMEKLQNGDRFYYLQRLDGLHLFGEMENNSFAAMIMRNTDATHLPSDVFSTPGLILEVDQTKQFNDLGRRRHPARATDPDRRAGILTPLVIRNNPATPGRTPTICATPAATTSCSAAPRPPTSLIAGIGDDTLFGDGGNDRLEGGFGNDIINGGDGDDIISDIGGDDNIKAGDGNDVVHAGPGLDLVMGDDGQDFIVLGTDMGSEVFAGDRQRLHLRQQERRAHPRQRGQRLDRDRHLRRRPGRQLRRNLRPRRHRRTRRVPRRRRLRRVHRRRRRRHHGRQPRPRQDGGHVRLRLGDLQGQRRPA